MPGFDNQVMWSGNLNFSDPTGTAFSHAGEFTTLGDLAIGTGNPAPSQQIKVGHLVGSGGITITPGGGNITIDGAGAGTATTYDADAGSATPAANILHIVGAGTVTTSAAGSTITITGSGGSSMTWQVIGASQTLAVNHGYFCTSGGTLALALPAVSAIGDTVEISLDGSTGFTVTQSAGQTIKFGNQVTTAGVGGSIASTGQGDTIQMVCSVVNLRWNILDCMGNLLFV